MAHSRSRTSGKKTAKKKSASDIRIQEKEKMYLCSGGCGYEFALLKALGYKPKGQMFCLTCTKQKERDEKIKSRIKPLGNSWVEYQMGRTM
jgi:hypothetical protein